MNTGKAIIAGLAVTIGLLAFSYGFEGLAQLAGPEEEEEVHSEETDTAGEEEAEEIELGDEQDAEDEAAEGEG